MPRQKGRHVDDPRAVGIRLREARERAGLSQGQLSFPGCTASYISHIESGKRIPSLQLLREFAHRLGVSEEYLATGVPAGDALLVDAEVALRLDDFEAARTLYERALAGARDDRARADVLEGLGHVAYRSGDPQGAVSHLQRALALAGSEAVERPMLAEILARSRAALGDLRGAAELFEACQARARAEGDRVNEVRFATLLGYALTDGGDLRGAERVLEEALAVGQEVKDPLTRARLYWSQARLRGEQGQSELAARYARQALETLRKTEDSYFVALTHQLLAALYNDLGRHDEALALLEEASPIMAASATPLQAAQFVIERARALAALGQANEAAELAASAAESLGDAHSGDVGRANVLLAEIYANIGRQERAHRALERAVELLEPRGPSRYLTEAYRRKADLLKRDGRTDEALAFLERALRQQEQPVGLR